MQLEQIDLLKRRLIKSACEGWDEGSDIEWSREWIHFDLTAFVENLIEKVMKNNLAVDDALEEAFLFGVASNRTETHEFIRGSDSGTPA